MKKLFEANKIGAINFIESLSREMTPEAKSRLSFLIGILPLFATMILCGSYFGYGISLDPIVYAIIGFIVSLPIPGLVILCGIEVHRVDREAGVDPLTNLLNRTGWRKAFSTRLHAVYREAYQPDQHPNGTTNERCLGRGLACFIDLDGFKGVNDHHGHAAGDFVLKSVAERMSASFRPSDILIRFGGDEFCVIMIDSIRANALDRHNSTIESRLNRFRSGVESIELENGVSAGITASIGVSFFSFDPNNELCDNVSAFSQIEQEMRKADSAMYTAKRMPGKNRMIIVK